MRKTTPTILFTSMLLAFGGTSALAQAPSNNPANNASRNTTMQPGATAVTPQARAGANGAPILPNPNNRFAPVRNFVEVEPGVFKEVVVQDAAPVQIAGGEVVVPELDKAVARQRLRDQQAVAINGQRWNMIVPRTGADRTNQMPDDPPSPLLTR